MLKMGHEACFNSLIQLDILLFTRVFSRYTYHHFEASSLTTVTARACKLPQSTAPSSGRSRYSSRRNLNQCSPCCKIDQTPFHPFHTHYLNTIELLVKHETKRFSYIILLTLKRQTMVIYYKFPHPPSQLNSNTSLWYK